MKLDATQISVERDLAPEAEDVAQQTPAELELESAGQEPTLAVSAPSEPHPSGRYIAIAFLMTGVFLCIIAFSNRVMAPWLYEDAYKSKIADTLVGGENYAVHDLNVDIRGIRQEQIAAMEKTPDIMILGASHWQEAHENLTPGWDVFNAHVHRDYYDDFLAMVEVLIQNDRLPRHLVISIRDSTFTRPENRTDALWHPWIEEYRQMEERLGLEPRSWQHDVHFDTLLDLFSVPLGLAAVQRWIEKDETPGPTSSYIKNSLDVLLADGSISWSKEHLQTFTYGRSVTESLAMANTVLEKRHEIDPSAVYAVDRLFALLQDRGVEVTLVHPPFNPTFYTMIEGTSYESHLDEVHSLTVGLAAKFGFGFASSFNPKDLGCTSSMYIDAEHGRPACLKRVMADITHAISDARDPYSHGLHSVTGEPNSPQALQAGPQRSIEPVFDAAATHLTRNNRAASIGISPAEGAAAARASNRAGIAGLAPVTGLETPADAAPFIPANQANEQAVPLEGLTASADADPVADPDIRPIAGAGVPDEATISDGSNITFGAPNMDPAAVEAAVSPASSPAPIELVSSEGNAGTSAVASPAALGADGGRHYVRLLSTYSSSGAEREAARLRAVHPEVFRESQLIVQTYTRQGGRLLYSIETTPVLSRTDAQSICAKLSRGPRDCLVRDAS